MTYEPGSSQGYRKVCPCNPTRVFTSPGAFKNHSNTCPVNKDDLWGSFLRAKAARVPQIPTTTPEFQDALHAASSLQVSLQSCFRRHLKLIPFEPDPVHRPSSPLAQHGGSIAIDAYIDNQLPTRPAKRVRKAPSRFLDGTFVLLDPELQDVLPAPLLAVISDVSDVQPNVSSSQSPTSLPADDTPRTSDTLPNAFGVFRRYDQAHSGSIAATSSSIDLGRHDPEARVSLATLSDITAPAAVHGLDNPYAPFPSKSAFLLSDWFWNHGAQKSKGNFQRLLAIIGAEDFVPQDIAGINWQRLDRQLGINDWDREEWQDEDAGWAESSVHISVPFHRNTDNPGAQDYTVKGFYHRSLTAVIREKLSLKKDDAGHFHLEPYELLWQHDPEEDPLSLYGEMYTSPAFRRAHRELQDSPAEPGCSLPRVVVACMFWSDATHLTQFGNAKITPLYLYFGNESKYRRSKPSCKLAEHVAFFQQLPDAFADFANKWTGDKKVNSELKAFCTRELAHEQWRLLLDDEFIHAYEHGMVLRWAGDDQERRFYPRIMTYSTDYPEKIPKKELHLIGTDSDRQARLDLERRDDDDRRTKISKARNLIYGRTNFAIDSAAVERLLKPESLVPTLLRLHSTASLNLFDTQTTILGECLREFQTEICPLFATRELRREAAARERRASSKKADQPLKAKGKKAAVLSSSTNQQATPAAHEAVPSELEVFVETREELPAHGEEPAKKKSTTARREKRFSLSTYKVHALGDYYSAIRTFGTTDSYSTETGELEHRVPKSNYKRTSRKFYQRQMASIERKQSRLLRIGQTVNHQDDIASDRYDGNPEDALDSASSPADPAAPYHIGVSQHIKKDIRLFINHHTGDPCMVNHLLPRLKSKLKIPHDPSIPPDPRSPNGETVFYKADALYQHNILRVNYTTYDVRRAQDVLNPRTDHRDFMLLRRPRIPNKHEYRYGRILGVYHVNAIYHGPQQQDIVSHRLDFVWVRWFEFVDGHDVPVASGWSEPNQGLGQLSFPPILDNSSAFGFVDPADILRACHIIPRFSSKLRHTDGKGLSGVAQDGKDWCKYYINRFVDRDMLMRFHWGLGVGHVYGRGTELPDRLQYRPYNDAGSRDREGVLASANPTNNSISETVLLEGSAEDGEEEDFSNNDSDSDNDSDFNDLRTDSDTSEDSQDAEHSDMDGDFDDMYDDFDEDKSYL
ncbi:hypothetical protein DXG01_001108 [Tephrocybe rancida]|nr:hypothetical protein DXG01_001108 [Tephrocybe rancida]